MPAAEIDLADDIDEYQYFLEKEWSDGFPVVAPTETRLRCAQQTIYHDAAHPSHVILPLIPT